MNPKNEPKTVSLTNGTFILKNNVMKKSERKITRLGSLPELVMLTFFILFFVFAPFGNEKIRVDLDAESWIKGNRWIDITKNTLLKTDLSARDVLIIIDSLNEFQSKMNIQINQQLNKKDTTQKQ